MPAFFEAFKRTLETDMFYSYLIYFIAISLGSMYEFLCIMGFLLIGTTFLLTFAHWKDFKKKVLVRRIGKIMNVSLTIIAFINIFANDLYFSDFKYDE